MSIIVAITQLETKLKELGRPVSRHPAGLGDPPAILIGAPRLSWSVHVPSAAPDSIQIPVIVAAKADEYALDRLLEWVPQVAAKVEELRSAVLAETSPQADPTLVSSGGADLPAYELRVEMAVS